MRTRAGSEHSTTAGTKLSDTVGGLARGRMDGTWAQRQVGTMCISGTSLAHMDCPSRRQEQGKLLSCRHRRSKVVEVEVPAAPSRSRSPA